MNTTITVGTTKHELSNVYVEADGTVSARVGCSDVSIPPDSLAVLTLAKPRPIPAGLYMCQRDRDGKLTYVSDKPGHRMEFERGMFLLFDAKNNQVASNASYCFVIGDEGVWTIEYHVSRPKKGSSL